MSYEGPRGTRKEEFSKVMELVDSIFVSAREKGTSMEKGFPLLFNQRNLENMRIFLLNGRPVSHIGLSVVEAFLYGCRLKIGMVGAVGTDPAHRGKGLAGKLLSDCMRKLLVEGADFVMVSGIRSLYDRAGCVMAGKVYSYDLTNEKVQEVLKRLAVPCKVQECDESQLDSLTSIYETEPIRYLRTREDFAILLDETTYARPRSFLIELGGEAIAYVCIETRWGEDDARWIVEFAGSRIAIVAAIPQLLERLGLKVLRLTVPHHDIELLGALSSQERPKSSHFGGTMRLINPQGFLEKLKPCLVSRIGERANRLAITGGGDGPMISLDDGKLEFEDEKALTWFLFGQPEIVEERFTHFIRPLHFKYEAKMFADVFPLPTFLYGLNYI